MSRYQDHQRERLFANLAQAIQTMRDACDDAEQRIDPKDEAASIQRVLHSLAWGHANACGGVERAMAALEDMRAIEIEELKGNQKP